MELEAKFSIYSANRIDLRVMIRHVATDWPCVMVKFEVFVCFTAPSEEEEIPADVLPPPQNVRVNFKEYFCEWFIWLFFFF